MLPRMAPQTTCTAFLLAAGLGTRLRPLTLARPKPLLPVGGIPMLDHALAHLVQHGHDPARVLVNAHHLWQQVAAWAEAHGAALQVELPDILGTGGGLRAALDGDRLAPHITILNGDILSDVDLTALAAACPPEGAAMALRHADRLGTITPVRAAPDGRVQRIGTVTAAADAPPLPADPDAPGTHFTGVHCMSRAALAHLPPEGFSCVIRTAYRTLVPAGQAAAVAHAGVWVDIGTPQEYLRANLDVLDGRLTLPVDPWRHAARGEGGSLLGAGARLEGQARHSVVGAGAVVPAGASVEDCVVWDGVVVPPGHHRHAILYDGGLVCPVV